MNHIMILYDAIIKRDVKDIVNRSQQGINLELKLVLFQLLRPTSSPLECFLCSVLNICHEFTTSPYLEQSVISEPEQSTQAKAKFTIHLFLENPEQY